MDATLARSNNTEAKLLAKLVLMDMINQETGQRGFLLSGKEASLEPYNNGIRDFAIHSADLKVLIRKAYGRDSVELRQLNSAVEMANDWKTRAADPEIDARRQMNKVTKTSDDINAFIKKGIGKKYMDEMRGILSEFVAAESALIVIRNKEQKDTSEGTNKVTDLGTIIALIIVTSIAWLTTRATR